MIGSSGKKSNVDRLVVLPFKKSVQIAYMSIRVRFFRSLITTLSLVLAVSFLTYIWVGIDVANGMLATQDKDMRSALVKAGYDLEPEATTAGSSPKQRWIVILSLLVCVVGIVNAQLMAVTERFREIGTMKCLGALNRFILRLFILEAGMQGFIGALIGAAAGAIFAILFSLVRFGPSAVASVSFSDAFFSIVLGTVVGCLLSLLGVFYPALVAARMQPVQAMRVDE